MSDDGQAFPWGLKPGGTPEEATPVRPVTPVSPVDQGHFVAVPDPHALPSQPSDFGPPSDFAQPADFSQGSGFAQRLDSSPLPEQATPSFGHESPAGMDVAAASFAFEQPGTPAVDDSNPLDNLFGEGRFVDYQPGLDVSESPFQRPAVASAGVSIDLVAQAPGSRAPLPRRQRTLIWVTAALAGVVALGGLFLLGKTIAPSFAAAPVVEVAPSAAPEAVLEILGPLVAGTYGWDDLLGTECVEPWGSAWDQDFTVVDCGEPHAAQLVFRGTFEDSALAAYPGVDELQSRMNLLCASRDNIDYSAAKKYDDIQLSASFAASESDWVEGNHDYFCFVSRSSGEPLTTNVAMPDRAAPVVPVVVEPEP